MGTAVSAESGRQGQSRKHLLDDMPMRLREATIHAIVADGEFFLIDAEPVKDGVCPRESHAAVNHWSRVPRPYCHPSGRPRNGRRWYAAPHETSGSSPLALTSQKSPSPRFRRVPPPRGGSLAEKRVPIRQQPAVLRRGTRYSHSVLPLAESMTTRLPLCLSWGRVEFAPLLFPASGEQLWIGFSDRRVLNGGGRWGAKQKRMCET